MSRYLSWLPWRGSSAPKPLETAAEEDDSDDVSPVSSGQRAQFDARWLFAARFLRMFAFGGVTVVLLLLLSAAGLTGEESGLLMTLILVGDLFISLALTSGADRIGRKRTLVMGSLLALLAAVVFSTSTSFFLLMCAGIVGVISPAGGEIGPFLAVEQAVLADMSEGNGGVAAVAAKFGRYHCVGDLAKALGMLVAGNLVGAAIDGGWSRLAALRLPLFFFGACALAKAAIYCRLSPSVEPSLHGVPTGPPASCCALLCRPKQLCAQLTGLRSGSARAVLQLSVLFSIDAFAGGFTISAYLSLYFAQRWALSFEALGGLLAAVSVVAGLSGMLAGPLVQRFGAVQTMVYTHLPSNVLLILVPLMPTMESAATILLLRNCISQMDVPARQAYVATRVGGGRPDLGIGLGPHPRRGCCWCTI